MPSAAVSVEPFFEPDDDGGQRFYLLRAPAGKVTGSVLFVHAWCEEMNKSRRMVALQAQQLAEAGYAVLQVDLAGCGDSSGEFADASWERWVEDVRHAAQWLSLRFGPAPLWLWGLRSGCLLASQVADSLHSLVGLVFWQPAASGSVLLQQFLRLKVAGEALDGKGGGKVEDLKRALQAGSTLEVAGYDLPPALALGLDGARLKPAGEPVKVAWLEVAADASESMPPASEAAVAKWREAGHDVHTAVVAGSGFWRTTEIEDAPALIAATNTVMQGFMAQAA